MRPIETNVEDVSELLRKRGPMNTEDMLRELECSRATLYVKLIKIPYVSSCNKNGKYHSLSEMVNYDSRGLWYYQEIVFSRLGTLKNTIQQLVDSSEMGLTTGELNSILKTRVTPQLVAFVKEKRIVRVRQGRHQVYYNANPAVRKRQNERRRAVESPREGAITLGKEETIQILVAIVKHHAVTLTGVKTILSSQGIVANERALRWIFTKYEIEKKGFP